MSFQYVVKRGITIEYLPMNIMGLKSIHRSIPDDSFLALKSLSDPALASQKNEFTKILKKSTSSQNLELLLHKKIIRIINETFLQNLKHWKELPWFHQTKDPVRKSIRKVPAVCKMPKLCSNLRLSTMKKMDCDLLSMYR